MVAIDPAVTSGEEADETGIASWPGRTRTVTAMCGRCLGASPADRVGSLGDRRLRDAPGRPYRWPRSTTAATWSGRRFAWSTQTSRFPRSAPRAARWCGPNRWRRSTSRASIHHIGTFPQLEDQMTNFTSDIERDAAGYSGPPASQERTGPPRCGDAGQYTDWIGTAGISSPRASAPLRVRLRCPWYDHARDRKQKPGRTGTCDAA